MKCIISNECEFKHRIGCKEKCVYEETLHGALIQVNREFGKIGSEIKSIIKSSWLMQKFLRLPNTIQTLIIYGLFLIVIVYVSLSIILTFDQIHFEATGNHLFDWINNDTHS